MPGGTCARFAGCAGLILIFTIGSSATVEAQAPSAPVGLRILTGSDATAPAISLVTASSITFSAATITWTTNEASDSQVIYGPTTAYGTTSPLNTNIVTSHTITLNGLTSGTLYHYRVRSRDAAGNQGLSGDFTFTTLASSGPVLYVDGLISSTSCSTYDPVTRTCIGGSSRAYKTLAAVNGVIVAGETALIRAGTYNTLLSPVQSGTSSQPITYQRYGTEQVILSALPAISLTNRSYIVIDGVTIRVSGCSNICYVLLDNSHHVTIQNAVMDQSINQSGWPVGIRIRTNSHHNRFLDNRIGNVGFSTSEDNGGVMVIGTASNDNSDYNLFEYNTLFHGGHHIIEHYGSYNVFRNNVFHNEAWNTCTHVETNNLCGNRHIIIDGDPSEVRYNVFDGNRFAFGGVPIDSTTVSGFGIRTPLNIVRRNLFYYNDGPGIALETYTYFPHNVDFNHIYHNVFFHNGFNVIPSAPADYRYGILLASRGGAAINDVAIKNNIFYDNNSGSMIFGSLAPRSAQTVANNWEQTGNPLFVNTTVGSPGSSTLPDLHLQSGSAAINAGGYLTTTVGAGSGTVMSVADAGYFTNGFGVIEGDQIQLQGQTARARILNIDYTLKTITLDTSLTWQAGLGVTLAYEGTAPDIGAYER